METLRITILNKEVKKILIGLENLNLLKIKKENLGSFKATLKKLRNRKKVVSIKKITREVELVRTNKQKDF